MNARHGLWFCWIFAMLIAVCSCESKTQCFSSETGPGPTKVFRHAFHNTEFFKSWNQPNHLRHTVGSVVVAVETYKGPSMQLATQNSTFMNVSSYLEYLSSPKQLINPMYLGDCDILLNYPGELFLGKLGAGVSHTVPEIDGFEYSGIVPSAVTVFIGNGSSAGYHYDRFGALLIQVVGSKRIFVAPPSASDFIGINEIGWGCRFAAVNSSAPSTVKDHVVPGSVVYDLGPGDAIFIPNFYWHATYAPTSTGPSRAPDTTMTYFLWGQKLYAPHGPHASQKQCTTLENPKKATCKKAKLVARAACRVLNTSQTCKFAQEHFQKLQTPCVHSEFDMLEDCCSNARHN